MERVRKINLNKKSTFIKWYIERVITSAQSETKAINFLGTNETFRPDKGQNELVHKAFPTGAESLTALDILNVHKIKQCTVNATVHVEACAKAGSVQDKQLPSIVSTHPSGGYRKRINTKYSLILSCFKLLLLLSIVG